MALHHTFSYVFSTWVWTYSYLSSLRLRRTNASNQYREVEEGRANQPHLSVISSIMQLDEVVSCLVQHGCKDITSDLDLERCTQYPLAQGGFGAVHHGMLRSGRPVAIKCIEVSGHWGAWIRQPKSLKHTAHEMYTWSKCEHPGILSVLGFACFGGHILVILPWMQEGSIASYITQHPLCNRTQLCIQVAEAVAYLHSKGVVHGDIKGENVVVSDRGHAQLIDFGSAKFVRQSTLCFTQTEHKDPDGTLRFMAPELLNRTSDKPTFAADIYALGMTMLQIITGQPPYADINFGPTVVYEVAVKRNPPTRPNFSQLFVNEGAGDKLWGLLTRCWAYAPGDRPTGMEVRAELVEINKAVSVAIDQH